MPEFTRLRFGLVWTGCRGFTRWRFGLVWTGCWASLAGASGLCDGAIDADPAAFLEGVHAERPFEDGLAVLARLAVDRHVLVEDRDHVPPRAHARDDRRVMGVFVVPGGPAPPRQGPVPAEDGVAELEDVARQRLFERRDPVSPRVFAIGLDGRPVDRPGLA